MWWRVLDSRLVAVGDFEALPLYGSDVFPDITPRHEAKGGEEGSWHETKGYGMTSS